MPQTLPAASVGNDFLGSHIGELLFRQPASRAGPSERTKGSSNGSTICASDSNTVRRGSLASQSVLSTIKDGADIDHLYSARIMAPLGPSADPTAALHRVSESPSSELSSADRRSASDSSNLELLHLDQLPRAHKSIASGGGPLSPRVSFVTSFGAKPRGSGSKRAPSETGSSSYFGMGSEISSAGMSTTQTSAGATNWDIPFADQHQSFARAIEHNARHDRNTSQHSAASDVASPQLRKQVRSSTPYEELAAPTLAGGPVVGTKSQSFSAVETSQPVRQRLTRAATESTLDPNSQEHREQPSSRPQDTPSESSASSVALSKGAEVHIHRKQPSLIPKHGDERTFCFVDHASSGGEEDVFAEQTAEVDATLTSIPMRSSPKSSSQSSSHSSYKEVLESQYSANRSDSAHIASSATPVASPAVKPQVRSSTLTPTPSAVRDNYTGHVSVFPLKPPCSSGASRPSRRLRIQPNLQSRQSLLERTMDEQRKASIAALAVNTTGANPIASVGNEVQSHAPQPSERYDTTAYGAEQRTFRIQSTTTASDATVFPFTVLSDGSGNAKELQPPASHSRTSDWARAQSAWTSSSTAQDPRLQVERRAGEQADTHRAGQPLLRLHTTSSTTASTETASLMDGSTPFSPPETVVSTPELESPPASFEVKAEERIDVVPRRAPPVAA